MQRFGESSWRVSTYISNETAQAMERERKKTNLSESSFIAMILEAALLPDPIEQEGHYDAC